MPKSKDYDGCKSGDTVAYRSAQLKNGQLVKNSIQLCPWYLTVLGHSAYATIDAVTNHKNLNDYDPKRPPSDGEPNADVFGSRLDVSLLHEVRTASLLFQSSVVKFQFLVNFWLLSSHMLLPTIRDILRIGDTDGKAVCRLGQQGAITRNLSRTLRWVSTCPCLPTKLHHMIPCFILLTPPCRCATAQQECLFHQGG